MKALSLLQPWASLIGVKLIETRSWSTKYRGPLAIHASKGFTKANRELCWGEPFRTALLEAGHKMSLGSIPLGAVISTCNLVDCIKMTPEFIDLVKSAKGYEIDFGVYTVGRYAWILENVIKLEAPIPAKGALSLWEWEVPS